MRLLVLGWCYFLVACQPSKLPPTEPVPVVFVAADATGWQQTQGITLYQSKPFTGWQYQLSNQGDTTFVGAFRQGKAEGLHRFWHENGRQKQVRHYEHGWQEGTQRGWYASGKPAFVYHFRHDVYEGNCKEWMPTGKLVRDFNYHNGQETGPQRMWFADGTIQANYVARNGRNYGLTGVKNCVNVWDSLTVAH